MRLTKTILLQRMNKVSPSVAKGLMLAILLEFIPNPNLFALTGGPSQPEVQSFEPVGSSEMVDLSTGDFNYNIPIMDIGGYPLNLSYHAGVGMDDEASWTGLGWNLNPGVLNRNMRGLPDDFNGDKVKNQYHSNSDETYTVAFNTIPEAFGFATISGSLGVKYNNYRGVGFDFGIHPSVGTPPGNIGAAATLDLSFDSYSGLSLSPGAGVGAMVGDPSIEPSMGLGMSVGTSFNSRTGTKSINFGNKMTVGLSGSGVYSFASPTYMPSISTDMRQDGLSLNMAGGAEAIGIFAKGGLRVGFQLDRPFENNGDGIEKKAFGYYYEQNKKDEKDVLLDFNREKDASFSDNTVNLPLANHSYDIFSATGQGVGGSYRLFRSDIPMVHDDLGQSNGWMANAGAEAGAGNLLEAGLNAGASFTRSRSGIWGTGKNSINIDATNNLINKWDFSSLGNGNKIDYEPAYFKSSGDKAFTNSFDDSRFNAKTIAAKIDDVNTVISTIKIKEGIDGPSGTVYKKDIPGTNQDNTRTSRDPRNSVLSVLDKTQSEKYGLETHIRDYQTVDPNNPTSGGLNYNSRVHESRPGQGHHFSEVTVLQEGGQRYVYGIPAYNIVQIDKTFNVSGREVNCQEGQVTYLSEGTHPDNTKDNHRGKNHLFQSSTTPPYAHSFLLTGYLSDDYVDVTGNGISDDDLGTAVKFNYSLANPSYRWRVPYKAKSAALNEGQRSNNLDDIGNYSYGEKELWYMHSMETKTQVAVFFTSNRQDAHGVINEDGGLDAGQRMKKLDRIVLYSKQDFEKKGIASTPVKTVHFEYDYTLCPNVDNNPNANGGKLTLKKVFFTYGKSHKGRTSSYEFDYSSVNPSYNLKGSDAWGTFKENPDNSCGVDANPSNADFPYTNQNRSISDDNASAWALTKITLPSGGSIKIEYEADDYAYVQDRKAMRMFKIAGFGNHHDWEASPSDKLYTSSKLDSHHDLVYVDLPEILSGSEKDKVFREKYLDGISDFQFTIFTDIDNKDHYEYVKGYCEIDIANSGVLNSGDRAYIRIKTIKSGDKKYKNRDISPIATAAWNYARLNCDYLIHPLGIGDQNSTDKTAIKKVARKLSGFVHDFTPMFQGYYHNLQIRKFCKFVKLNRSWVRLIANDGKKIGGGHRVKKIFVNDDWASIGSGNSVANDAEYGTEYIYTTTRKDKTDQVETISSGVTSYEPMIGGDENPFRLPIAMEQKLKTIPSVDYFLETPIGESFFPGANVIYSKVKTRAIGNSNIKRTGTGYTLSEYYTAKDYPTIVSQTELQKKQYRDNGFWTMFQPVRMNATAAAQGYKIELNDMHGKPKASYDYDEYGKVIGGVKYEYQHEKINGIKHLTNMVKVVSKSGNITQKEYGVEIDLVNDARSSTSVSTNYGLALNSNIMILGLAPVPIPLILPSYLKDKTSFHSMVSTKVVKRFGILKKTIALKAGSSIETQNLLYDDQTGHVLLTSTQNEFNDNTYAFNYPAHWAYEKGMGQAYKNIGLTVSGVKLGYDEIIFPNGLNEENYLVEGDEVSFELNGVSYSGNISQPAIRYYVYRGTGGNLNLIDKDGTICQDLNKLGTLKVLRSGRRNKAATSIGSVASLADPSSGSSLAFSQVIDASAVAYKDDWKTHFSYMPNEVCDTNALGHEAFSIFDCLKSSVQPYAEANIVISVEENQMQTELLRQTKSGVSTDIPLTYPYPHNMTQSDFCDGFAYKSKLDNNWYALDIFDEEQMTDLGLMLQMEDNDVTGIDLCSAPCNAWYQGSQMQHLVDSLKGVHCGDNTPCNELFSLNFDDGKYQMEIASVGEGCDIPPLCLWSLNVPKEYFGSITQLLSYTLSSDGSTMSVSAEVEDFCGNLDTITFNIDRCGQNMRKCEFQCYVVAQEYAVNPFTFGMKGNWRPYKNYKYLENRNYQAGSPDSRKDGQYSSFYTFWNYSGGKHNPSTNTKWVNASEITKYSPFGQELETKDALNRFTAEQYGFFHTLPVAAAGNAEYTQIGYDGFEDYDYVHPKFEYGCETRHFDFPETQTAKIDDSESHSGWYSFKLDAGESSEMVRPIEVPVIPGSAIDEDVSKKLTQDDDLGVFSPSAGTYVLSAWVKESRTGIVTEYTDAKVQVEFTDQNNATTSTDIQASGLLIESWQRVNGTFEVPVGTKSISIKIIGATDVETWFDDLRVHPEKATMKTFAYDATTLRNMAAMDENNYATFYEYDAEGSLIRVKKETAKGIITIQENKTHINKK